MHILNTSHASRQLYLSSNHADYLNNGKTSDAEWHLRSALVVPNNIRILLSVVDCQIPHSIYTVNDSNCTLRYIVDEVQKQIVVSLGNLNATDVVREVNNTDQSDLVLSVDKATNKFRVTALGSPIEIVGSFFGLAKGQHGSVIVATDCFRFSGISSILVASNFLIDSIDSHALQVSNIIARIPISSPPGGMISYQNQNMFRQDLGSDSVSTIKLQLLDEDRNLLDLNGLHFSITMQLDFVANVVDEAANTLKVQHLAQLDEELVIDSQSKKSKSDNK